MNLLKAVKYAVAIVVGVPLLLGVIGIVGGAILGGMAGSESTRLERFCQGLRPRTDLDQVRLAAQREEYSIYDRSSLPAQETPESRIAVRLLSQAAERTPEDVAVIVRKPGIGYYACLIHHDQKALTRAEYLYDD